MFKDSKYQPQLKSFKSMKLRIFIMLALVAVNIFAITRINTYVIAQEQDLLRGINLSGRQRMLSQRIPLLTSVILREGVYADLIKRSDDIRPLNLQKAIEELSNAIELMETSHKGLLYGSKTLGLPKAPTPYYEYYFNADPVDITGHTDYHSQYSNKTLNDELNDFIEDAKLVLDVANKITNGEADEDDINKLINGYNHLYDHAFYFLLYRINESVYIYEAAGIDSLNKIKILEPILFAGSLVMLFIIWLSVFRPMEKRIKDNIIILSNQKQNEEREKNRLNLALEGTSTGIWDWDMSTGKIHCSQVVVSLLGLSDHLDISEFNASADISLFLSLLKKPEKKRLTKLLINHIKHDEPFSFETELERMSGDLIWVRIRGGIVDHKDYISKKRMLGSIEDITTIKNAARQKTIFTNGIESAKIPFAIIDLSTKNRKFSYVSPAFCELTGYSKEKILDGNINIFTGPETSMNVLDQIDYAFSTHQPMTLKVIHYKADGKQFWNEISLEPIIFQDGEENEQYYSVIFNDLTDTIAKEKQEVARQRNESLGSLAGSVAHEINNLLMPMTMAKDMLEDSLKEDCDPFAREQLNVMVDYANQAKNIVHGILTFSRKETKDIEKVALYEQVKEAVNFIQSLMSSKTTLTLLPPENDKDANILAMINTTEMKQIITNMCRNAEDAFNGKNGTITISFKTDKITQKKRQELDVISNEFSIITIQDNGAGIDPEHLDAIFEPLFTTKDVGQGTGLGLSIVVGILRSWGGAVTVNSIRGKGTTFEIYIPIYKHENDFDHLMDLANEFSDDNFIASDSS